MIGTDIKLGYKVFGLNVLSDLFLPELLSMEVENMLPEVVIEIGDLSSLWSEISKEDQWVVVNENFVMFEIQNTAIYLVQNGNRIIISPFNDSIQERIRLYLLGTCMGALLLQRNILPLHGSAIAVDGKAIAIVGHSGVGKSTLATSFLNNGYQLLSDDIIAITLSSDNIPIVSPAFPQQKLWQESLKEFGFDENVYRPIYERKTKESITDKKTKYAIPVDQFFRERLPLAGIFVLDKTEKNDIDFYPIQSLDRIMTMLEHTFRRSFISSLGLVEWHFKTTTAIINKINLYHVKRPLSSFTAPDLTKLIIETIKKDL